MHIANISSIVTIDHKQIQEWIEKNNGYPAFITCPGTTSSVQGLRVDFKDKEDEKYLTSARKSEVVDWKHFFSEFEKLDLAFIYNPNGRRNPDMLYRFIKREAASELEEQPEIKALPVVNFETSLGIFQNGSVETPISAYEMFLSQEIQPPIPPRNF